MESEHRGRSTCVGTRVFASGSQDGFLGWYESLGPYQLPVVMCCVAVVGLAITPLLFVRGRGELTKVPSQAKPEEPTEPRPTARQREMYDRVGVDAIRTAVDQFYNRVLADPQLSKYFERLGEADIRSLRAHQARFVGQLLGGPIVCTEARLRGSHARLGITNDDYWLTVAHLLAVLTALRVDDDIVKHVSGHLIDARQLIVTT
jgi:hemoglobin